MAKRIGSIVVLLVLSAAVWSEPQPQFPSSPTPAHGHGHEHDEHGHEPDGHEHEHDGHEHEHDEHGHEHDGHEHEHAEKADEVFEHMHPEGEHGEEEHFVPRAYHTDKPAIFGYTILQTEHEKLGVSVRTVFGMSRGPWLLALLLLPIYLQMARRRGLSIQ